MSRGQLVPFANLRASGVTGPPTSGTWTAGTAVTDNLGRIWVCTTAGTPGQWATSGGTLLASVRTTGSPTTTGLADLTSITFTAPAQPVLIRYELAECTNNTAGKGVSAIIADASDNILQVSDYLDSASGANSRRKLMVEYLADTLTYGTSYTFKGRWNVTGVAGTATARIPLGGGVHATQMLAIAG